MSSADEPKAKALRHIENAIYVAVNGPHDNTDPVTGQPFDGAFSTPEERQQFHVAATLGAIEMAHALGWLTLDEVFSLQKRLPSL